MRLSRKFVSLSLLVLAGCAGLRPDPVGSRLEHVVISVANACHSAVVHDVMKDLPLAKVKAIRAGEDPQAAYLRYRMF